MIWDHLSYDYVNIAMNMLQSLQFTSGDFRNVMKFTYTNVIILHWSLTYFYEYTQNFFYPSIIICPILTANLLKDLDEHLFLSADSEILFKLDRPISYHSSSG
jgi:hypothetical protein